MASRFYLPFFLGILFVALVLTPGPTMASMKWRDNYRCFQSKESCVEETCKQVCDEKQFEESFCEKEWRPEGRSDRGGRIVMEFQVGDKESFSSPTRLSKRLRQRLRNAKCTSSRTVEETKVKFRDADLHKQVSLRFFHSNSKTVCLFGW
ncbi:hypothetical protein VNO78_12237 [Psophocarpus tetragonolobus]|uniref:Uncharacterized protein n=1 Tax=Psophocarpus tetragonolobus TaxID=3891 RepID=A0AAN9XNT3_PSOTE